MSPTLSMDNTPRTDSRISTKHRNQEYSDFALDMRHSWIGPMPPDEFIATFLPPIEGAEDPSNLDSQFSSVPADKSPTETFDAIASVARNIMKDKFYVVNTMDKRVKSASGPRYLERPDGSTYAYNIESADTIERNELSLNELPWEVKTLNEDPFQDVDPNKPFEQSAIDSRHCAGQLTNHNTVISSTQHRTHLFMILIFPNQARFIRWDRSGAIVSELFAFKTKSHLALFLHRFAHSSDAVRGKDTTVTVPENADVMEARNALTKWMAEYEAESSPDVSLPKPDVDASNDDDVPKNGGYAPNSSESDDDERYLQFFVPTEEDGQNGHSVITCVAFVMPDHPVGRATRCYPVFDLQDKKVYLMKDSWRTKSFPKEWHTLKILEENDVPNVPTYVAGSELPGEFQRTRTQDFFEQAWHHWRNNPDANFEERIHQRFLMREIGIPLKAFKRSYDVFKAVCDAIEGHDKAYNVARILHRDVSDGNILIHKKSTNEFGGLLIDWDLARPLDELEQLKQDITGTAEFISIRLLGLDHDKDPHSHVDDLESFIWVLLYIFLRYLPSEWPPRTNLVDAIQGIFYRRSIGKIAVLESIGDRFEFQNNSVATELLYDVVDAVVHLSRARFAQNRPRIALNFSLRVKDTTLGSHQNLRLAFQMYLDSTNWPPQDKSYDFLRSREVRVRHWYFLHPLYPRSEKRHLSYHSGQKRQATGAAVESRKSKKSRSGTAAGHTSKCISGL